MSPNACQTVATEEPPNTNTTFHELLGEATSGQLEAATLSVRVFYQSASTVPCCIHLVSPLTRSTKQCDVPAIKVNLSAKNDRNANHLYNKPHGILERFPISQQSSPLLVAVVESTYEIRLYNSDGVS